MDVRICPECILYEPCKKYNRSGTGGCMLARIEGMTIGDISMYKGVSGDDSWCGDRLE